MVTFFPGSRATRPRGRLRSPWLTSNTADGEASKTRKVPLTPSTTRRPRGSPWSLRRSGRPNPDMVEGISVTARPKRGARPRRDLKRVENPKRREGTIHQLVRPIRWGNLFRALRSAQRRHACAFRSGFRPRPLNHSVKEACYPHESTLVRRSALLARPRLCSLFAARAGLQKATSPRPARPTPRSTLPQLASSADSTLRRRVSTKVSSSSKRDGKTLTVFEGRRRAFPLTSMRSPWFEQGPCGSGLGTARGPSVAMQHGFPRPAPCTRHRGPGGGPCTAPPT